MVNKIILDKLKNVKDVSTCLTILYGIGNDANAKMFRDCKNEFPELRELMLIETTGDRVTLTVPFYEKDNFKPKKLGGEKQIDTIAIKKIKAETVEDWISSYRALFPIKSITGLDYHITGDLNECIKRMKKFMLDYRYSKEIIMQATKDYIGEQRNKNWTYTKKAHKFIRDLEGSILSEYCESAKRGDNNKPLSQYNAV